MKPWWPSLLLAPALLAQAARPPDVPAHVEAVAAAFDAQVERRIELPREAQARLVPLVDRQLAEAGIASLAPQFLVVVDRSPRVQAVMLWWWSPRARRLIGVAPASTGRPGGFEYFETPVGVFRHAPGSPDFRAQGTRNGFGVMGYGATGMRVFDFGWQPARRTWGRGGASLMRLQMHSTDPVLLEPRIGTPQSKGCIRIPADFNRFLDRQGLLDADYAAGEALGMPPGVAAPVPAQGAGRYLVVVDSGAAADD